MRDKTDILVGVGLFLGLLLTSVIYWPGLDGPFLLDDYLNIESTYVPEFDFDRLYYEITHNRSGTLGRPVSVLSLLITGIVHGPEAWGYKFHNLAIHLINGLLLFWLVLKLLPRLSPGQTREKNLLVTGFITAIWLLHPLLVSTVLYAVQRMAQLSALFTLAALIVYVYGRESAGQAGFRFYLLNYLALPVCILLSLLSKENGILIPLYIIAMEISVYRLEYDLPPIAKKRLLIFLGFFIVLPVVLGSVYLLTHLDQFANYTARDFTLVERLMTQLKVVAVYLKMIILPRLSDMTLFHDYVEPTRSFDLATGLLLLVLIASVTLVFLLRKKAPVLSFAIAWFLVSHSLESSVFSLELMFEHRNYLAAVGPVFAVVYYLFNVPGVPSLKYMNVVYLLLVLFLTVIRVQEWSREETIYQIAVAEHPDSARAQTQLANLKYNRGDLAGAIEHLRQAQQNSPREFGPVLHEVALRCNTGMEVRQLLDEAASRAERYPVTAYSLNSIDNLLIFLNESRCPEMTLDDLLDVIGAAESQAGNQGSPITMGILDKTKGQIYMLKGDYPRSIELAFAGYEKTGMTNIIGNLARNLIQLGLLGDAEQVIQIMENINEESGGSETALITPLLQELQAAKNAQESENQQPDSQVQ